MKNIFGALFTETSNSFVVDYKSVSHDGDNACVRGDKNGTPIRYKVPEKTKPGSKDFRNRIDKISSGTENDAERANYHLDNYVSLQGERNEIFLSFQHFP